MLKYQLSVVDFHTVSSVTELLQRSKPGKFGGKCSKNISINNTKSVVSIIDPGSTNVGNHQSNILNSLNNFLKTYRKSALIFSIAKRNRDSSVTLSKIYSFYERCLIIL